LSNRYFDTVADGLSSEARVALVGHMAADRYAIPVYSGASHDEELIGSGVLLKIGDAKVFCTAAHVFDKLARTPMILHADAPAQQAHAQPHVTRIPDSGRNADKYDLYIDRFGIDRQHWFREDRYLTIGNIDQNELPQSTHILYMFAGYPASANRASRVRRPPVLATYVVSPRVLAWYEENGFVANMHLVAAFNPKKMNSETGQIVTPRKPEGISGGPVWRLGHKVDVERRTYEPRAIGIGLEYRRDALIALRMSFVLETIRSLHPDLSPLIPRSELIGVGVTVG
jgi:hypothetical protein